jgi:hypothetical protein
MTQLFFKRSNYILFGITMVVLLVGFFACSSAKDREPVKYFTAPETVMSIACDGQDNVYAVTIKGNLLEVTPDGKSKTLYTGLNRCSFSSRGLAVLPNGDVIASDCEAMKDILVKIDPNGKKTVLSKFDDCINCIAADSAGKIYIGFWTSKGNLTVGQCLEGAEYMKGVIAGLTVDNKLDTLYEGGIPIWLATAEKGKLYGATWGKMGPFKPEPKQYTTCGVKNHFWIALVEESEIRQFAPKEENRLISKDLNACSYVAVGKNSVVYAYGSTTGGTCGIYKIQQGKAPARLLFKNDKVANSITSLAVSENYLFFTDPDGGIYRAGLENL